MHMPGVRFDLPLGDTQWLVVPNPYWVARSCHWSTPFSLPFGVFYETAVIVLCLFDVKSMIFCLL